MTVVAVCQFAPAIGQADRTRERLSAAIEHAADAGAQVIVVPELSNSGYVFADRAELRAAAETADGPTLTGWAEQARRRDVIIVGGFAERDGEMLHNSAALVDATGVRCVYRKAHLWDTEKTVGFTPGDAVPSVVDTAVGRLGVMVCYDLEFPEWVRIPALAGAQLLCAPANWPLVARPDGERPAEVVRVQANASVNRMCVAVADRAGTERGQEWIGGSVIVDADGYPVTDAQFGREQILVADVDMDSARVKSISAHNDVFGDRRRDLYPAGAG